MPVRCVAADDHPLMLEGICRCLGEIDEVEVIGIARDGAHAMSLIAELAPDVALLALHMPKPDGIEIARRLTAERSATAVILYTADAARVRVLDALDAGARGFVLKEASLDSLVRAIKVVSEGGTFVDAAVAGLLISAEAIDGFSLTKREREILLLLADGMTDAQVASELSISPLTVHTHVKHAMEKLHSETRTHAVAQALRQSLIE